MEAVIKIFLLLTCLITYVIGYSQEPNKCLRQTTGKVLIIQDERPQMNVLADFLRGNQDDLQIDIADQKDLPEDLDSFNTVILYIHLKLKEHTENKVIEYTENGGRLILLHHSISSGKAKNENYFPFLGIQLDGTNNSRDPELPGAGYVWVEGVTLTLINLDPGHCVSNYNVQWDEEIKYKPSDLSDTASKYPSLSLPDSEVYLNHKFTDGDDKTILMGLKFYDNRNDQLFMQDRAAWYKTYGEGDIFYFMPGHSSLDFQNVNYSQMILNAINYRK